MEKLITKSFKRLLSKGIHRGFITYEELGKSLGKRHSSQENLEKAFLHIFENKVSLVEKKSDFRLSKKKETTTSTDKNKDVDKSDDPDFSNDADFSKWPMYEDQISVLLERAYQ